MKPFILVLALIMGGCAGQWRNVSRPDQDGFTMWMGPDQCEACNMRRFVLVKHPEHPEKYLYVAEDRNTSLGSRCVVELRPAYASDTGRTYRWSEIPTAFPPCP